MRLPCAVLSPKPVDLPVVERAHNRGQVNVNMPLGERSEWRIASAMILCGLLMVSCTVKQHGHAEHVVRTVQGTPVRTTIRALDRRRTMLTVIGAEWCVLSDGVGHRDSASGKPLSGSTRSEYFEVESMETLRWHWLGAPMWPLTLSCGTSHDDDIELSADIVTDTAYVCSRGATLRPTARCRRWRIDIAHSWSAGGRDSLDVRASAE